MSDSSSATPSPLTPPQPADEQTPLHRLGASPFPRGRISLIGLLASVYDQVSMELPQDAEKDIAASDDPNPPPDQQQS